MLNKSVKSHRNVFFKANMECASSSFNFHQAHEALINSTFVVTFLKTFGQTTKTLKKATE